MTNSRQANRFTKNYIDNKVHSIRTMSEAIVIESYVNYCKILVLPERQEAFARYSFNLAENEHNIGKLPIKDSRVLITFLSNEEDPYEDIVIIGQLFDDKNIKPSRVNDGTQDQDYYQINPTNGGQIVMYKNNDNDDVILIEGKKYVKIKSNNILIGDDIDSNKFEQLVKKSHLDNYYNKLVNVIKKFFNDFMLANIIGDLGIPLITQIRIPKYGTLVGVSPTPENSSIQSLTQDTTNITSDVKAV